MKVMVHMAVLGVAVLVLGGLLGCAGSAGTKGERLSNADLVFVTFGSVNGEVAPCG